MSRRRNVPPPSGSPAPETATLPDGRDLDLIALATEICRRYREEFPDEEERYGEAGMAWCRHDNRHILNWAALAEGGGLDLDAEIGWLARVLAAREFPVERLVRNLELCADVVPELAPRLREAAAHLQVSL